MHVVVIVLTKFMLLSSVWNPYHLKDIRALEDVQQHATGLIPSFKHVSPQSLYITQITFAFVLQKVHGHDPYL